MVIFLAAFSILLIITPSQAVSVERGYKEAQEYFIYRNKNKAQGKASKSLGQGHVDSPDNIILNPSKYFIGLGLGEIFDYDHYSLELGMIFVQSRYFQQSLHFEYIHFDTKGSAEFKAGSISNRSGQGVFLLHSVQLSSQIFYFGPEISAGVGRIFDNPRKGNLIMLKAGLTFSNKWSRSLLFSGHLYYRRSQYFKENTHGDGMGLTLKFGF